MAIPNPYSPSPYLLLIILLCFCHNSSSSSIRTITPSHTNLVYKHCPNNSKLLISSDHPTDEFLPQILSSLFQELLSKSSTLKFYQTSLGDEKPAVSVLYQCRKDLTNDDCRDCVSALPEVSNAFCGNTSIPARVHLSGCYMHYEHDGYYESISRVSLQHKKCGEDKAAFGGFKELREAAFGELEKCVMKGNNGFCEMGFRSLIHVMGQCEGDLEACDCGACVNRAVEIAMDECGDSVSGEVYLESCFISYGYYGDRRVSTNSDRGYGGGINVGSGKLIAIVLGGLAVLGFGFILLCCLRSCKKKNEDW